MKYMIFLYTQIRLSYPWLSVIFTVMILGFMSCEKEPVPVGEEFRDSRDGTIYKTVWMNGRIWMAENLAYLPQVDSANVESDTTSHYYVYGYQEPKLSIAKETTNFYIYGVLYNWLAAKTACPSGWHLPSDEEWKGLETSIGMSREVADLMGYRDEGWIGNQLKSTTNWYKDGNGSDSERFNVKPGSRKAAHNDLYSKIGEEAYFWTSTTDTASNAVLRYMLHDKNGIYRSVGSRTNGFSIRCIKD